MRAGESETGEPIIPPKSEAARVRTPPSSEDHDHTPPPLTDRFRPYTPFIQQWIPWLIIASVILVFGKDFIFLNKVFLPMDFLQFWRPWDSLFPSKTPINNIVISDAAEALYPFLHFVGESLKAGYLPLWNPFIFLGLPTTMMGSHVVFNPLSIILLRSFDTATAHSLSILINLSLIASFSYLFFLERGLTRTSALLGSMVLTLNGHLMVWLEFGAPDFAYAGMAASLYCFEKSLKERRLRFSVLNGIAIGILLLGGSIQWVFFLVPLMGLYATAKVIEGWDGRAPFWSRVRPLRLFLAPALLGILIASPNLLFFADYAGLSQRTIRSFAWVKAHTATFYPELLTTFLFPNFFGYQPGGVWFARDSSTIVFQNYNELGVYMGVVTLPLTLLALRARESRVMAIFWSLILGGALLVAMKPPLLYYLLYQYAPGFNGMQPTRTIILLPPAFAFLAALGMDSLQRQPLTERHAALAWKATAGLAAVSALLLVGAHLVLLRSPIVIKGLSLAQHFRIGNPDFLVPLLFLLVIAGGFFLLARHAITPSILGACFVALLIVDLVPFGLRMNTRTDRALVFPPTKGLQYLAQDHEMYRTLPLGFRYNTLMTVQIAAIGGYSSMYPADYLQLISAMEAHEIPGRKLAERNQNYLEPMGYTSPLLPMLNVKYVLTPPEIRVSEEAAARYTLKYRSEIGILQANRYLPRIFVVFDHRRVNNTSEAIDVMLGPLFDPSRTAIVENPLPGFQPSPQDGDLISATRLKGSRVSSDRFELDVHLPEQGILVVSEQFLPGWEARVDETPSDIVKVNAVLMGLVVPKGDHHVSLRFLPRSVTIGLIAMAGALAVSVLLLAFEVVRGIRRQNGPPAA
jgi:hypothetical protein